MIRYFLLATLFTFPHLSCEKQLICPSDSRLEAINPSFSFCQGELCNVAFDTFYWQLNHCDCPELLAKKKQEYNKVIKTYELNNNLLMIEIHHNNPARFNCIRANEFP